MADVRVGWINILEASTVTVTSAATGYDAYRLYDRKIGKQWKGTSTATQTIKADQGASGNLEINTLVIPSGHNLAGCTLDWQWSTDNVSWSNAVDQWTGVAGIIRKTVTVGLTKRYWRFVIAGASVAPQAGEVFMTNLTTLPLQPFYRGIRFGEQPNVMRIENLAGSVQFVQNGQARRYVDYSFPAIFIDSELTTYENLRDGWAGHKPVFVVDHKSREYFAEIIGEVPFTIEDANLASSVIRVLEVL